MLDRQNQYLALGLALHGKLAAQQRLFLVPVSKLNVVDLARPDNVDDSEVIALLYPDVSRISVSWQHKCSLAFYQEKGLVHSFVVQEEELVLSIDLRLQQGTHPQDKRHVSVLKHLDFAIPLLIDVQGYLGLEVVGQFFEELVHVLHIPLAFVAHCLFDFDE
jgi:hypothetical protein